MRYVDALRNVHAAHPAGRILQVNGPGIGVTRKKQGCIFCRFDWMCLCLPSEANIFLSVIFLISLPNFLYSPL